MKILELPEDVFAELESYRRRRRLSRAEALKEVLRQAQLEEEWWQEISRPGPKAARVSEEEAERLAVEGVREVRRVRRK